MSDGTPTTLLFPLRTSVEFFRDPASPDAEVRAKQGAVLFERLIFETGLFDASLMMNGALSNWRAADHASDDELRHARTLHEGSPLQMSIGVQPARGIAADPRDMHVVLEGTVSRHYVAEWESVLRRLAPFELDWIGVLDLPGNRLSAELNTELGNLNFACLGDETLRREMPDDYLREYVYQAFNRDSLVASSIDAVFNITPQFLPMRRRAGGEITPIGGVALEVWSPNLGALPWDVVLEFREHPGAQEARDVLRRFEASAWESDPDDTARMGPRIQNQITAALLETIDSLRPRLGVETFRQALQTGVSTFVPVVGPAAALAETGLDQRRFKRSWLAALMMLRPRPQM